MGNKKKVVKEYEEPEGIDWKREFGRIKPISEKKIRKMGKRDGRDWKWRFWPIVKKQKDPTPKVDDTVPSQNEQDLIDDTEGWLNSINRIYKNKDAELFKKYCHAKKNSRKLKEKINEIKEDAGRIGRITEKESLIKTLQKELDEVKLYVNSHKPSFWSKVFLVLIAAGEACFNIKAFDLMESNRIETWIMAITIIVGLPLGAHHIGATLKDEKKTITEKQLTWMLTIFAFLLIAGIGWIREEFLKQTIKEQDLLMSPLVSACFFIVLNLFLFVLLMTIEYKRAPFDSQKLKEKGGRLPQLESQLISLKEEVDNIKGELPKLEEQLDNTDKEIESLRMRRISLFQTCQSKIKEKINEWQSIIRWYRDENLHARQYDKTVPDLFKKDPLIRITQEAGILAENLDKQMKNGEVERFLDWICQEREES